MLKISLFYTAICTFYYVLLSLRVIAGRWKFRVGIGDGEKPVLQCRIRVHGNAAEYLPLGLFLLALIEFHHAPLWLLHFVGGGLLIGRLLHGIGLTRSKNTSPGRFLGMVLTFNSLIASAVWCIWALMR